MLPPVGVWAVLSPSLADHPLRPANDRCLGELLPHQQANHTQAAPKAHKALMLLAKARSRSMEYEVWSMGFIDFPILHSSCFILPLLTLVRSTICGIRLRFRSLFLTLGYVPTRYSAVRHSCILTKARIHRLPFSIHRLPYIYRFPFTVSNTDQGLWLTYG